MFEQRIYSSPSIPDLDLRAKDFAGKFQERKFQVYEKGVYIDDIIVPEELATEQFIEGFLRGFAFASNELRTMRFQ